MAFCGLTIGVWPSADWIGRQPATGASCFFCSHGKRPPRDGYVFGVTQTDTGTTTLPGAGLPTSTRSADTSSPVSKLNEAQGLGMRPKVIFWMGWPVAVFMMVATMGMLPR